MRGSRRSFRGLLGCLALGLGLPAFVLATGAAAGTPQAVTITADEFFPASGTPTISIHASGGLFGAGIDGSGATEQVILGSETAYFQRRAVQIHGVDIYTTAAGAISFKWQFNCM